MECETQELLTIARLPSRFFESFTGEVNIFKNPGISLMSFIISKAIRYERVLIPPEMEEIVNECWLFNGDGFVLKSIYEKLMQEAEKLLIEAHTANVPHKSLIKLIEQHADVLSTAVVEELMYGRNGYVADKDNRGLLLRQSLYMLQDYLVDLKYHLEQVPSKA